MGWEGDWSSVEALRGRRPLAVLNQLRAALDERVESIEGDIDNIRELESEFLNKTSWFNAFQSHMTDCLDKKFINQNEYDSSEEYSFSEDDEPQESFPFWTANLMMDHLESTRLPVPKSFNGIRPWAFQQYQILNQLQMTGKEINIFSAYTANRKYGRNFNWETARDQYIAADWTTQYISTGAVYYSNFYGQYGWTFLGYHRDFSLTFPLFETDKKSSLDIWHYAGIHTNDIYQPLGVFENKNTWYNADYTPKEITESHEISYEPVTQAEYIGANFIQPPNTTQTAGWKQDGFFIVLDFAVPGGFEYGDWI